MLSDPSREYIPYTPVSLLDRQWPNKRINKAPIWLSTDLRDGNQALFEPMNLTKKHQLFQALVQIGVKEIEMVFDLLPLSAHYDSVGICVVGGSVTMPCPIGYSITAWMRYYSLDSYLSQLPNIYFQYQTTSTNPPYNTYSTSVTIP